MYIGAIVKAETTTKSALFAELVSFFSFFLSFFLVFHLTTFGLPGRYQKALTYISLKLQKVIRF
ncbi:MAG: hypothetical protein U5L09_15500 [Bacteroidales bacterium]|nr:hypothetical protein [Bacteroidales bacterium]